MRRAGRAVPREAHPFKPLIQAQAGIQLIKFDSATSQQYLQRAYDTAWAGIIKGSPQHGPQMQKLFRKQ